METPGDFNRRCRCLLNQDGEVLLFDLGRAQYMSNNISIVNLVAYIMSLRGDQVSSSQVQELLEQIPCNAEDSRESLGEGDPNGVQVTDRFHALVDKVFVEEDAKYLHYIPKQRVERMNPNDPITWPCRKYTIYTMRHKVLHTKTDMDEFEAIIKLCGVLSTDELLEILLDFKGDMATPEV